MSLPRILLLGDSIRMSYQGLIKALLEQQAEVVYPTVNCTDTRYTRTRLEGWLTEFQPDAVHWNNGLHDLKHAKGKPECQVPLDEYRANLSAMADRLAVACPGKVIWATCTPVIEEWHNPVRSFDRYNDDIAVYNQAALEIMYAHEFRVTDLGALVSSHAKERLMLRSDGVHYNDQGRLLLAGAVIAQLRSLLGIPQAVIN
jgi:hypothetical protein